MSATAATTTAVPVTVPLKDIERELSRQMKVLQGPGEEPVHCARMSNLVIYTTSQETADSVTAQIPDIVNIHPARVLLLINSGEPGAELTAQVLVRPQGRRLQACSEQVILRATTGTVDRLPFAVRALLIGDLPTNLWWEATQPPPLAGPFLYELAEQAQQIIYDSLGWPEPARGVAATSNWLQQLDRLRETGRWRVASDLNWRRLKYWRRLLSQALDPASAPGVADAVQEIVIEHGPHAVVQGWELISWLVRKLGWQVSAGKVEPGVEIVWNCQAARRDVRLRVRRLEEGPAEIRRIRIETDKQCGISGMQLIAEGNLRLAIHIEGSEATTRTVTTPPLSAADLVGKQLSDRERDPVFYQSMAVAQVLAHSVLK